MKIKVAKNGPYLVSGNIPLYRRSIVSEGGINVLKTIEKIETNMQYALCRCGESANKPFCDGTHVAIGFNGNEIAARTPYTDRAELLVGETIDLLDDDRCAFARFCHRQRGSVWDLTEASEDPENMREAVEGASECPTGRLTSVTKDGKMIEPKLKNEISIVEDPQKDVAAGIFVTGEIPIEDANGQLYEQRNRVALCRCGASKNKPFCDAMHVSIGFTD